MATFQAQVQGLTQLTMGTDPAPSTTELTQFIIDGVNDVTSKWIEGHPGDAKLFSTTSGEQTSNASVSDTSNSPSILSVIRENGTNNDWVPCKRIPPELRGRVVDSESLFFASKQNPVYFVDDNGISVFPVPGSDPDSFKVTYVNATPVQGNGGSLTYASNDVRYFPDGKYHLIVLYASIKTLEAAAGSKLVAQDTELQQAYGQLAGSLKAEYMTAFQTQQPQQGAPPRR